MEKQIAELILPEGMLDHFDIEKIEQGTDDHNEKYIQIYLAEKNQLPEGYDPSEYESKGFTDPKNLIDFPIRNKNVYLSIKRRRWRHKKDPNRIIYNDYSHFVGSRKITSEFSAFFKRYSLKPGPNRLNP